LKLLEGAVAKLDSVAKQGEHVGRVSLVRRFVMCGIADAVAQVL
jgi:hypothetical protein